MQNKKDICTNTKTKTTQKIEVPEMSTHVGFIIISIMKAQNMSYTLPVAVIIV